MTREIIGGLLQVFASKSGENNINYGWTLPIKEKKTDKTII